MSFAKILETTAPIYLIIAGGYLSVRLGLFEQRDTRALGRYVAAFCIPALLFDALSSRPLAEIANLRYLGAYGAASMAVLLATFRVQTSLRRQPAPKAAIQGLGMSSSNSAFIGYPIAAQAFGHPAAVALALNMILENGIMLPLALALAGSGDLRTRSFSRFADSLRGLERNPMMLALVAGFAVSAFGIPLPAVVTRTVRLVSSAASPVALFVIGGSLVGLSLQGMRRDVGAIVAGKLLLHPLAVLAAMCLVAPIDPTLAQSGVILAAAPMMSIYAVLGQRYELQGLCAAALLATTTVSFVSISAWMAVLHAIGVAAA